MAGEPNLDGLSRSRSRRHERESRGPVRGMLRSMTTRPGDARRSPMRIRLSDDRRERMLRSLRRFFAEEIDVDLGDLAAGRVLDFFAKELGAPVYNQAVQDIRAHLQGKLDDLAGEFFEPDEPYSR